MQCNSQMINLDPATFLCKSNNYQDHTSSDPVLPDNPLHQMLIGHFHR